ncbi:transposase [Streptomyces sp. col6]|nr:transposase [Streptomyces sp. col6]
MHRSDVGGFDEASRLGVAAHAPGESRWAVAGATAVSCKASWPFCWVWGAVGMDCSGQAAGDSRAGATAGPGPPARGAVANIDDEAAFAAVIHVLVSGCAWRALPPCFGASESTLRPRHQALKPLLSHVHMGHESHATESKPRARAQARHTTSPACSDGCEASTSGPVSHARASSPAGGSAGAGMQRFQSSAARLLAGPALSPASRFMQRRPSLKALSELLPRAVTSSGVALPRSVRELRGPRTPRQWPTG